MKKIKLIFCTLLLLTSLSAVARGYTITSPDKKIVLTVSVGKEITWQVDFAGERLIEPSRIALQIGEKQLGIDPKVKKSSVREVNSSFDAPIYKRKVVEDRYTELTLECGDAYGLIFRAYNDGVAYRWTTRMKGDRIVTGETAQFNFAGQGHKAFVGYVNARKEDVYSCSFENIYKPILLSEMSDFWPAFAPVVVEMPNGVKCGITESDLMNYPGMFLRINAKTGTGLNGDFAPYPVKEVTGGHNDLQSLVTERANYIAKVEGTRQYPWRTVIVAKEDKELLNNDMVYKLASPCEVSDISWIKPGKLAWDYWNDWNIYNVDFRAGINTPTYKYYIDFAAKNGVEYVLLDEGWADSRDIMKVVPDIDLPEIVKYAKDRNVGIILWGGWLPLNQKMDEALSHYAAVGIKGFKVDFMDRDDQPVVDFYERLANKAAEYKLLINYHGAYKPTGLHRTYPNVITFEGVYGMEYLKGDYPDMPANDATIPFVRMLAGPVDYTPGAMFNANKKSYKGIWSIPMSQGTRAHQVALYLVLESPLSMMADSPNNYMKEPETTEYIAQLPTTFDQTEALAGKIGEYAAVAREKNGTWYVGAITNWDARDLTIDFSFLKSGKWEARIFKDGINADRNGNDYKIEVIPVDANTRLNIKIAEGGGWNAMITPQNND